MSERDNHLIAEFNAQRSETAFAALVRQHISMVFSTALRQVGDPGAAEEISQNVFVTLAQSSGKLASHPTIAGWLHQTTLNKAREWLRSELRRRRREQTAVNLNLEQLEGNSVWSPLVPLLDEALLQLRETDRSAVVLHFMEGLTYQEVGSALAISEEAARKRVDRCLEQLTLFFQRRGFATPALTDESPIFTLSLHTASAELVASATAAGLAAAKATISTLTLIKGALNVMAWSSAKTAVVAGTAAVLVLISGTIVEVNVAGKHRLARLLAEPTDILTPTMMTSIANMQPDGSIIAQFAIQETNTSTRTAMVDSVNDVEKMDLITDDTGRPMKTFKRPAGGSIIVLNKPVPPGGTCFYRAQFKMPASQTKNIEKKAGDSVIVNLTGGPGNTVEASFTQVWRLPAGAILLDYTNDMDAATNAGRIELTIDKILPPNRTYPVSFHYRMPGSAAKTAQ